MSTKQDTITFKTDNPDDCRQILRQVHEALLEKGYDPVGQIVGYLASDDPTYITSSNGARSLITRVSRYALMRELVEHYIESTKE